MPDLSKYSEDIKDAAHEEQQKTEFRSFSIIAVAAIVLIIATLYFGSLESVDDWQEPSYEQYN